MTKTFIKFVSKISLHLRLLDISTCSHSVFHKNSYFSNEASTKKVLRIFHVLLQAQIVNILHFHVVQVVIGFCFLKQEIVKSGNSRMKNYLTARSI